MRHRAFLQFAVGIFAGQVEVQRFAAVGRRREQPIEGVTLARDISVVEDRQQGDETLLMIRGFLFVC